MSRGIQLAVFGIAAYLLILAATLPAVRVSGLLQSQDTDLSLAAVSGTAFSGQAGQVVYQGLNLGPVHWTFRPLALLAGKLEYLLELTHPDNHGQLALGITLFGRIAGHDADLVLQPDRILNHYSPMSVTTSGVLHLAFEEFSWVDQALQDVSGQIKWQDGVVLEPVNLVLGQVELAVETTADGLVGQVTAGGELGVSGEIALSTDSKYRVNLRLHPGKTVSTATREMLGQATQVQANGDYLIDLSGQF